MKCLIALLLAYCALPVYANAQAKQGQARIDSLLAEVSKMKDDASGLKLLHEITYAYTRINPTEGLKWTEKELALAQKIGSKSGEASAYTSIGNNSVGKGLFPLALDAYLRAMRINEEIGNTKGIGIAALNIGNIYLGTRDYPKALEWYFKSLKIAQELGDLPRTQQVTSSIGNAYAEQGNYREALGYQLEALRVADSLGDELKLTLAIGNVGNSYKELKQYPLALVYCFRALRLAEEAGYRQLSANLLAYIGNTYYGIATDEIATKPDSLVPAGREANLAKAEDYLSRGIAASREAGLYSPLPGFSKALSKVFAARGDYKSAFTAYKESIAVRDSMFNKENEAKIIRSEEGYKFSKTADSLKLESDKRTLAIQRETELAALAAQYAGKQAAAKTEKERQQLYFEEDLKRRQIAAAYRQKTADAEAAHARAVTIAKAEEEKREALAAAELGRQKNMGYAAMGGGFIMLLIAGIGFRAFRQRRASNRIIAGEQRKSEALLRNILPAEIAEELKESGATIARHYNEVSVLFTDFVNFTGTAEKLTPQQLVQELHECFSAFDDIIDKNGLEKIKTIGDAYMAVCGLPHYDPRHAQRCVQGAIEIVRFMERREARQLTFGIRIGINSGPVVAGIVGIKKFAYDIWGDTVNTASRMEHHSEPGRINISKSTRELVKDEYHCISRGALAAKGKGEVEMYFVEQKNLQTA